MTPIEEIEQLIAKFAKLPGGEYEDALAEMRERADNALIAYEDDKDNSKG